MIDDANEFLAEKLNQQFVRSLTETDAYKRMEYDSASKTFQAMEIPSHFYTKSPVCIISNWWADTPLFRALESRAEFFNFAPSCCELHREVGTWFWDQEIYDYVGKNLHKLRSPDARLYVKAANRKEAGLSANPWKSLIDSAHDDAEGQRVAGVAGRQEDPHERSASQALRGGGLRQSSNVLSSNGRDPSMAAGERRGARNQAQAEGAPKAERPHDAVVPDSDDDE